MRNGIEIRDATPADAGAIAALWHAGWMDGHADKASAELVALRDRASFRVRTERHIGDFRVAMVGPMLLGFHLCKGDEVSQFYVASEARGTGFARSLMADAEATLKAAGHKRIWLACGIGNDRARRFYEKTGWTFAGTERQEMETAGEPIHLDIWRMEKDL